MSDQEWVVEIIEEPGGDWIEVGRANYRKEIEGQQDRVESRTTGIISSRIRRVK